MGCLRVDLHNVQRTGTLLLRVHYEPAPIISDVMPLLVHEIRLLRSP